MAPPFEAAVYPSPNDLANETFSKHSSAQHQDIGVVVRTRQGCASDVVHERRADAVDLIGGDRHPDARPAQENTALGRSVCDAACDRFGEIRVIDRGGRRGPEVLDLHAASAQFVHDHSLGTQGGVITRDDVTFR